MGDSSPPSKKRRFFKDDLDNNNADLAPATPPPIDLAAAPTPVSRPSTPPKPPSPDPPSAPAFAVQLCAILGVDRLPPKVIRGLDDAAGGNVERAVNMYFDGSWGTRPSEES